MRGLAAVGGAPRTLWRLGAPGLDKLDPPFTLDGDPERTIPALAPPLYPQSYAWLPLCTSE